MTEREIKRYLNRPVRFADPKLYVEGAEYILTGAIIRLGERGYFYQAELTDRKCRNSVLICSLDKIEGTER